MLSVVEKPFYKNNEDSFSIGDVVRVHNVIREGEKSRIQIFQGLVIAKKHSGIRATFTVRKISSGIGVEKIFPVHSPNVEKIEVVKKGKVRRAKLYYLRDRVGKAALKVKAGGDLVDTDENPVIDESAEEIVQETAEEITEEKSEEAESNEAADKKAETKE